MNETLPAEEAPVEVGDYDGDGVEGLMVKFDRETAIARAGAGEEEPGQASAHSSGVGEQWSG
ncbi:MAG: hypothetical protein JSV27_00020 [Candidatus Bathyarchaeota archaeon]|nr:MAG: hypothetical protein JSV27_00020 [Candidatus Bathyarchaeota archaeon]